MLRGFLYPQNIFAHRNYLKKFHLNYSSCTFAEAFSISTIIGAMGSGSWGELRERIQE